MTMHSRCAGFTLAVPCNRTLWTLHPATWKECALKESHARPLGGRHTVNLLTQRFAPILLRMGINTLGPLIKTSRDSPERSVQLHLQTKSISAGQASH